MNLFGKFNLINADNQQVKCAIEWITDAKDWDFADDWENEPAGSSDPRIRDSIDYARTGAKRWRWLSKEGFCVSNAVDAVKRIKEDRSTEFAFAFAMSVTIGRRKQIIGFCYARRLWLGTVYLEFLGGNNGSGFSGIGSLLLNAVADAARGFNGMEIWGECTAESQGFYQKTKARLLEADLKDALKKGNGEPRYPRDWQLPGAIDDRFSFGWRELVLMSDLFRAAKSR